MSECFIAVEWGTARIRARLLGADGKTLGEFGEDVRLDTLTREAIAVRINDLAQRWPAASIQPMLLSGMIGSAMGWTDVARVPCPADDRAVARGAWRGRIGQHPVIILPGLACRSRFGDADILRGEEVSAIGALQRHGGPAATLLSVPGIHGKWLRLAESGVRDFHTSMTVELHYAITQATILASLTVARPDDMDAFERGVMEGAGGGATARLLFSARAAVQAGDLSSGGAASFIWGVLIGADVREGLAGADGPCLVTGARAVVPLFVRAIGVLGGQPVCLDDAVVSATGFCRLFSLIAAERSKTP